MAFVAQRLLWVASLLTLIAGKTHYVTVGGLKPDGSPNLAYNPSNIKADIGDKILFTFNVKNHTVTQSSFDKPCSKLTNNYGQLVGFDSGFMFVSSASGYLPTFEVTVNDTNPIWAYCQQINPPNPTHCQSGMVFAANAPDYGNTFDAFLAKAEASKEQDGSSSQIYSSTKSSYWESEETTTTTVTVTKTETELVTVSSAYSSAYWPGSPVSTYNPSPATHTIIVGGDAGFQYTPENITANVGDKVYFEFHQKNHTVTQSSFSDPCRKLSDTTYPPVYSFDSGFMPVAADATYFPNFTITVNDTNPIWGYCRQQAANFSHCGVGMVFAINANPYSDKSFAAFQEIAVTKNGTGFVNPFGNLTAPPASSTPGYGKSTVANLAAVNGGSDDSSDAKISSLVGTYIPAVLGLLGGIIVMLVALTAISLNLLRRSKRSVGGSGVGHFMSDPRYQTVPLTIPTFAKEGAHEYEEPRYSDRD